MYSTSMKSFNRRNKLKKQIHYSTPEEKFYVNKQEIRFAHLWLNIGYEQDGRGNKYLRPVLVLKKLGNVFWAVPLTTKWKDNYFYHKLPSQYLEKESHLILSQIRVLDKSRFLDKIGRLSYNDFAAVKKKLKAFLSL